MRGDPASCSSSLACAAPKDPAPNKVRADACDSACCSMWVPTFTHTSTEDTLHARTRVLKSCIPLMCLFDDQELTVKAKEENERWLLMEESESHRCCWLFCFVDRISLCGPGCPGTNCPEQACFEPFPASASRVLRLKACTIEHHDCLRGDLRRDRQAGCSDGDGRRQSRAGFLSASSQLPSCVLGTGSSLSDLCGLESSQICFRSLGS